MAVLLLVQLLIAACRRAPDQPKPKGDEGVPPNQPKGDERVPPLGTAAVTIVPGIHMLGELDPSVAYAVETSDGLVLIDTGIKKDLFLIKNQLTWLGQDWRRIRAVLLTHVHGDHVGAAKALREATGAKLYIGSGDAAALRDAGPYEAIFGALPSPKAFLPSPTIADIELVDEQVITVGDVRIRALATPGHSPGSICYLMERGGKRVLFTGDVIESLSPRFDQVNMSVRPLGTYAAYLSPRYRGDAVSYLATLRRLRAMPAPYLVLPGHPQNDGVPQSPLMTQARWETLLDPGISEMQQLVDRYKLDGAGFLDGVPKKLLTDLYYLGDFKDVAIYALFASSRSYLVNAPGGAGLRKFVMAQLKKLGLPQVAPKAVLLTSGAPEQIAGLADVLGKGPAQVVAPREAWAQVRRNCPAGTELVSPQDLTGRDWFPAVSAVVLSDRADGPVAYQFTWSGKTVLFTGRSPVKRAWTPVKVPPPEGPREQSDILAGVLRLFNVKQPDLWLPAFPGDGQNANLYDYDWRYVLGSNMRAFK